MSTNNIPPISALAIEELIDSAATLSEDYGDLVQDAVREAQQHPLDADRARSLYTRIIEILRSVDGKTTTHEDRVRLADEVKQEEAIVASVQRPASRPSRSRSSIPFVKRNGLSPGDVIPSRPSTACRSRWSRATSTSRS